MKPITKIVDQLNAHAAQNALAADRHNEEIARSAALADAAKAESEQARNTAVKISSLIG